jgi:hypothetical protein
MTAVERLICPACLLLRFLPGHLLRVAAEVCKL